MDGSVRLRQLVLWGLVLLAGWLALTAWREWHPRAAFAFLAVGQGKCIVIIAPNGKTLLVDGGSHSYGDPMRGQQVAERVVLPSLRRLGVQQINAVLVTHPHEDHCNAIPTVAREMPPALFWQPAATLADASYLAVETTMRAVGARTVRLQRGQRLWLDARHGVVAEVLGPPPNMPAVVGQSDANEASAVVRVRFGRVSVLLTGDAGETAQRWLLRSGVDLRSTVLDVPHHGSRHVMAEFLRAVRPAVAVISVGRNNPFGHPAPSTLMFLQALNATIWRTDQQGGLVVWTDGTGWRLAGL